MGWRNDILFLLNLRFCVICRFICRIWGLKLERMVKPLGAERALIMMPGTEADTQ